MTWNHHRRCSFRHSLLALFCLLSPTFADHPVRVAVSPFDPGQLLYAGLDVPVLPDSAAGLTTLIESALSTNIAIDLLDRTETTRLLLEMSLATGTHAGTMLYESGNGLWRTFSSAAISKTAQPQMITCYDLTP